MKEVDVTIAGSGFAGSILAWILASRGLRVALVDPVTHPRFAIGESSTPIADLLLRRLGATYGIGELTTLSTWGDWQTHHGQLGCGKKRGFSYFLHTPGERFQETAGGERSLLVAASPSDAVADTHWYRAEVDQFFFSRAIAAGAIDLSGHAVVACQRDRQSTQRVSCQGAARIDLRSHWVIDASGTAGVLARLCGAIDRSEELCTRTHSLYAHFRGVASWTEYLKQHGIATDRDPFDADDAAQHHLLGSGWMWMLRLNHDRTSIGYTAPLACPLDWSEYPSIKDLLRESGIIGPKGGLRRSGRLQRWYEPVIDSRRILLPTAATTIDPLHSTGIAHALAGVERIAGIVLESSPADLAERVAQYRRSVLEETRLLDRLVSTAYATIQDFPRFTAACMLYFAGAIACEERYQRGETPTHLWNADDSEFVALVDWACGALEDRASDPLDRIRDRLAPWNTAGLMDPASAGRYAYTATKRAS